MRRREFLRGTALAAGGVLAEGGLLGGAWAFRPYRSVQEVLFEGINRVRDPSSKTVLEKKHAPVIEAPERVGRGEAFSATVRVGEIVHPMSPAHYIQYVEVLAGNEPAGRVELSPELGVPVVSLTLRLDKPVTLVVREYCNLHGLWESRLEVAVS
ncbi:MAG: class II SORL domain-containing protein [Deferrisomatales bacterium]